MEIRAKGANYGANINKGAAVEHGQESEAMTTKKHDKAIETIEGAEIDRNLQRLPKAEGPLVGLFLAYPLPLIVHVDSKTRALTDDRAGPGAFSIVVSMTIEGLGLLLAAEMAGR